MGKGSLGKAVLDLEADGDALIEDVNKAKPGVLGALGSLGKAGGALLAAGLMIAVTAITTITMMVWDAGQTLDAAYDKIAVTTGATGKELEGLQADFDEVFSRVPTNADDAAAAVAGLNQRLGISGPLLQDTSAQLLEMTRITGGDLQTNIDAFTRMMGDAGIANEDAGKALDTVFAASQQTGIGVDRLMQLLTQFGAKTRNFGFTFEESAALMAKWEKEGVNTELVMGSLGVAAGKFASENKPLKEGLEETFDAIKNAKDGSKALAIAMDVFGARAGADMAAAIREGRFEIGDMVAALDDADGAIMDTAASTADWGEMWQVFQNKMTVALGPAGMQLMQAAGNALQTLGDAAMRPDVQAGLMAIVNGIVMLGQQAAAYLPILIDNFFLFVEWLKANQGVVVAVLGVIGAALVALGISGATAAWAIISPLLSVIAVILAIGAAAYLLYEAWVNNWGGIRDIAAAFWAWLEPILLELYNWFAKNIPLALQAVADFWKSTLEPALAELGQWLAENLPGAMSMLGRLIQDYVIWSFNNLMTIIRFVIAVVQLLANYWTGTLWPAIQRVFSWMNGTLFPFLKALGNFISAILGVALKALAAIWQNVVWPAIKKVCDQLNKDLMPVFKALSDWWHSTGQPVAEAIAKWFGQNVANAFAGLNEMLQDATKWLQDLATQLNNMQLPDWMTPGSPTPWEIGLVGVNDALKAVSNIGLPAMNAELGAMSAPAVAGGAVQLSSAGGMRVLQPVYSPFISTADEYEARRVLRPFIAEVIREENKK